MSEYRDQALKKIQAEYKSGKYDRYGQVMKADVLRQIEDFIEQDDEFAQAVVQGGTFEDCMKAVAKSCGQALSDVEAYRRAAARDRETGDKLHEAVRQLIEYFTKELEKKEDEANV